MPNRSPRIPTPCTSNEAALRTLQPPGVQCSVFDFTSTVLGWKRPGRTKRRLAVISPQRAEAGADGPLPGAPGAISSQHAGVGDCAWLSGWASAWLSRGWSIAGSAVGRALAERLVERWRMVGRVLWCGRAGRRAPTHARHQRPVAVRGGGGRGGGWWWGFGGVVVGGGARRPGPPPPQHYSCAMSCSCSCGASFVIPIPVAPHSIAKKIAIQFEMAHGKYDRVATPRVPAM